MEHQKISELAYLKWEAAGYPDNRHEEFWLAAEKELRFEPFAEPIRRMRVRLSRIIQKVKGRLTNAHKWGAALNN
jgi:hypothetical protein